MIRSFEYRLYTTTEQDKKLMGCLRESRILYNEMLEVAVNEYKRSSHHLGKYELDAIFRGRGKECIPASTVQCLADRLSKSFKQFFNRKDYNFRMGFPRFKSVRQWRSIHLRQYGSPDKQLDVSLSKDGMFLNVPKKIGGRIKIKLHRPIGETPKTVHLVLRADRHWYAIIVCDCALTPTDQGCGQVGIDLGISSFITDSNANKVSNPKHLIASQCILRRKQRALARSQRYSHRRGLAVESVAKTHLKVSRQRRDFLHKVSQSYANKYQNIIVEKLNMAGMLKNHHVAKSILDASWSTFIILLTYKAESAGHQVIAVPAQYTSQKCSNCGEIVPKSLSVRTHICSHCGYIEDRDVNAAKNILQAGARPSEDNVVGYHMRPPISLQQELEGVVTTFPRCLSSAVL